MHAMGKTSTRKKNYGNATRYRRNAARPTDLVPFHVKMTSELRDDLETAAAVHPLRTSSAVVRALVQGFVRGTITLNG